MGQYSWLYSDTGKQVINNRRADSYLLVPKPFQEKYGKSILERCYDGYGRFGGYDIYDLVAEWNREYLAESMLREKPKLENYGGLYGFEKKAMEIEGYTKEEIADKDRQQREFYYNNAVARYKTAVERLEDYRNGMSDEEMVEKYGRDWKREIGIDIACKDSQNKSIPYPIKITTREMEYEEVKPSKRDPKQGWQKG